jgi:murein DD-endopeptidase MepM/ murein hydrolase activator NlpD
MTPTALTITGGIRRLGARLLVVPAVVALLLSPSAGLASAAGGAEAAVPIGAWPLSPAPTVVHGFDPPSSAYGAGHRGVDLAGTVGEAVHAALGGRVTFAGSLAGRGVVVVDHGGTRTTYEPVEAGVHVGDVLATGAVIGTLALTQSHCLPTACLHWGWIRNADDVYLDPLGLLGLDQPVRLLPLWRAEPVTRAAARPAARAAASSSPAGPAPPLLIPLPYGTWLSPLMRLLTG